MTHYLFFKGFWNVRNYIGGAVPQIILMVVFGVLLALPFKFLIDKMLKLKFMEKIRRPSK